MGEEAWLVFDGYQPVWDTAWPRAPPEAHADYALLLLQQYAAHDDAVDVITRRALNLAVDGLADILISIGRSAASASALCPSDPSLAMAHVRVLAEDIGVRAAGHEAAAAARYARSTLKSLGYVVDTVPWACRTAWCHTAGGEEGSLPSHHPGGRASGRQGAWPEPKTVASGVATVLELARDLKNADTTATIELVLFGAEEVVDSNPNHRRLRRAGPREGDDRDGEGEPGRHDVRRHDRLRLPIHGGHHEARAPAALRHTDRLRRRTWSSGDVPTGRGHMGLGDHGTVRASHRSPGCPPTTPSQTPSPTATRCRSRRPVSFCCLAFLRVWTKRIWSNCSRSGNR